MKNKVKKQLIESDPNGNKGNAWVGLLVLLVLMISLGLALVTETISTITQSKKANQVVVAQALCDAGIEKAFWKLNQTGGGYTGENNLNLTTGIVDITITNIDQENKLAEATAYVPSKTNPKVTRKVRAKISAEFNDTDVSFHYGVQVGGLGVTMTNNAKIHGNVYTDGSINGSNGSQIIGDAFVSGAGNRIYGLEVTGNSHAHTLQNVDADGDAYYYSSSTLINTNVRGTKHPGSPDPQPVGLPISQASIDTWESWAEAGGTFNGNKTISGTQTTLGPLKINGNLTVTNGGTLTLTGVLWVTGNISFSNNAIIKLAPTFGASSSMIIADSPTNKATYGKITVSNNVSVQGSGNPKSYIMLLSTNTGSTTGNPAINVGNNSTAVVYYATVGMIKISNNAHLRAVSGGGLYLANNAEVQYDSGLADANFSGGPGGSWQITEWQIVSN